MRYISEAKSLRLIRNNGEIAYSFFNGVLIVGTPTGTGPTEIIDAAANADPALSLQHPFPNGANDLERAGLNTTFFAAPPISPGATTVTADIRYEVISGTVVYDGTTYRTGQVFVGTAVTDTSTTDGGLFALALPTPYFDPGETDGNRAEFFRIAILGSGDEMDYDLNQGGPVATKPFDHVQ